MPWSALALTGFEPGEGQPCTSWSAARVRRAYRCRCRSKGQSGPTVVKQSLRPISSCLQLDSVAVDSLRNSCNFPSTQLNSSGSAGHAALGISDLRRFRLRSLHASSRAAEYNFSGSPIVESLSTHGEKSSAQRDFASYSVERVLSDVVHKAVHEAAVALRHTCSITGPLTSTHFSKKDEQ